MVGACVSTILGPCLTGRSAAGAAAEEEGNVSSSSCTSPCRSSSVTVIACKGERHISSHDMRSPSFQ